MPLSTAKCEEQSICVTLFLSILLNCSLPIFNSQVINSNFSRLTKNISYFWFLISSIFANDFKHIPNKSAFVMHFVEQGMINFRFQPEGLINKNNKIVLVQFLVCSFRERKKSDKTTVGNIWTIVSNLFSCVRVYD